MPAGTKRDRDGNARSRSAQDAPRTRFQSLFENFRDELDEHYDRKERVVKASRDVTAQSKKMYASHCNVLYIHIVLILDKKYFCAATVR